MPERLKITMGIRLLLALGILSLLALAGIGLWSLRSQMLEDRQAQLRKLLDSNLSIARAQMTAAGGPESEAGKKAFFSVLRTSRFGDEEANYFFAYDYNGVVTSLNDQSKIGENRIELADVNGFKFIKEIVKTAKGPSGTGFVEYMYEKGVGGPATPKLSLIQNVPEIGGLVGVGAYIDDMDTDFYRQFFLEGAMLAAVLTAIGVAGFLIGRKLMAVTSEMEHQLAAAIALQSDMLPSLEQVAQIQGRCPLDLSSYYRALDGIGGDIWGIEASGPQRVLLYTADFTGHGVAAALNTALFHSFVHIECKRTDRPASLLRRLNKKLHKVLPTGHFATMSCATFDFKTQTMEYSSAGAPPQIYRKSSEAPYEVLSRPSLPLGILPDVAYESQTVAFRPGGELVLYTDGLVETPKPPRSLYTTESLREFLNKTKQGTSLQLCDRLIDQLSKPAIKVDDDITLIIAKFTGSFTEFVNDYEI